MSRDCLWFYSFIIERQEEREKVEREWGKAREKESKRERGEERRGEERRGEEKTKREEGGVREMKGKRTME